MIFLTVGGQMPFDRLVRIVDEWASECDRDDVFAQIGPTDYRPGRLRFASFMQPREFEEALGRAEGIVAHAGMGTILKALEIGKMPLVFPRLAKLGETRTDHQVATARRLQEAGLVRAAFEPEEMCRELSSIGEWPGVKRLGPHAPEGLLSRIRRAAFGEDAAASGAQPQENATDR